MTHRALVIDDNKEIRESVSDILTSLGHLCDCVGTQEEARKRLKPGVYSYVLLDLEIPVKRGGFARVQNGVNLLREIHGTKGMESTPVLIMTGHGTDSPELAVQLMKLGAVDFVTKPFPASGDTLDKRILEAIHKKPDIGAATDAKPKEPPVLFRNGRRELVIFADRIEVCGVELWSDTGIPDMREMLLLLARKENGRYVRIKGTVLNEKLGRDPSNPIGRLVKYFRDKATERLLEHRGLVCELCDIINEKNGYFLTDCIDVKIDGQETHEAHQQAHEAHGAGERKHGHEPHEPGVPFKAQIEKRFPDIPGDQAQRLCAICEALSKKVMTNNDLRRLTGVSRAQHTRDLKILDGGGLLVKVGRQRERTYKLASAAP